MTITVKTIQQWIVVICIAAIILSNYACMWKKTVTSYPVNELDVVKVDEDADTVVFKSPDGKTFLCTVGDVVGKEHLKIIAINEYIIEVERPPDDSGRKSKTVIPVVKIIMDAPIPIPSLPAAKAGQPVSH